MNWINQCLIITYFPDRVLLAAVVSANFDISLNIIDTIENSCDTDCTKLFTMNCGLLLRYRSICRSHFAPVSLTTGILIAVSCSSAHCRSSRPFPAKWSITFTAYHLSDCLLRYALTGLLTDTCISIGWRKFVMLGGVRETLILFFLGRLVTEVVAWPLQLSITMRVDFSSPTFCFFCKHRAQWCTLFLCWPVIGRVGECVICLSGGKR